MYYYFVDKINLIAVIMMIISASVIIDNLYRLGRGKGAMINVYISLFACILHYYRFAMLKNISYDLMINLMGVVALTGLAFAIIMEALCVFSEYEVVDRRVVKRKKNSETGGGELKNEQKEGDKNFEKKSKKTEKKSKIFDKSTAFDVKKSLPRLKDAILDDEKTIDEILGDIEARAEKMSKKSKDLEAELLKTS